MKPNLKALWQELIRRHQLDSERPGASRFQVFNRTADEFACKLVDDVNAPTSVRPATCVECGAGSLEHFYTSRQGGYVLCPGCFQGRASWKCVQGGKAEITTEGSP